MFRNVELQARGECTVEFPSFPHGTCILESEPGKGSSNKSSVETHQKCLREGDAGAHSTQQEAMGPVRLWSVQTSLPLPPNQGADKLRACSYCTAK